MAAFSLQVFAAIRGYHVYKESWEHSVDDLITFERHIDELHRCIRCLYLSYSASFISTTFCPSGIDNAHDRYAVAAYEAGNDTVVDHLPREISHWSTCFMDHGGSIEGTVTGARRYCTVAGGREIPCKVTFLGKKRLIA